MARFISLSVIRSLLALGVLVGASAVRSESLLAQATATVHASARVVSTEAAQAGQANGLTLAQETLEAVRWSAEAETELRRELHGAALVARVVTPTPAEVGSAMPADQVQERLVQVTVHYAAN